MAMSKAMQPIFILIAAHAPPNQLAAVDATPIGKFCRG
jgi:hypothetical protein